MFALFFRYVCSILKVKGVASCCCTLWERTKDASSVVLPQLLGDGGSFGCLNVTFYNRMHMHLHILGCSLGKFCTFFTEHFICFSLYRQVLIAIAIMKIKLFDISSGYNMLESSQKRRRVQHVRKKKIKLMKELCNYICRPHNCSESAANQLLNYISNQAS